MWRECFEDGLQFKGMLLLVFLLQNGRIDDDTK